MIRHLRIAVSVFFGVSTVALCVLWVRSYWRSDMLLCGVGTFTLIQSDVGHLILFNISDPNFHPPTPIKWEWESAAASGSAPDSWISQSPTRTFISVPYWLTALVSGSAACLAWKQLCSPRFSLRTLLIATTLVSVVLGLAVWAGR